MKVLVAHDGSEQADKALQEGVGIAKKTGASVAVVSVVPDLCLVDVSSDECKVITDTLHSVSDSAMRKVKDTLAAQGVEAEIIIKSGNPAEKILEAADEVGADMIVIGSYGRHGAKRFLLGSVSSKVVEHSKSNVLVIK